MTFRLGKIRFNYFLFRIKVSGVLGLEYQYRQRKQDSKYITLFYLDYTEGRTEILREADTRYFDTIISIKEGVRTTARQIVRADTLYQLSLARVQARRVDGYEEEVYEQRRKKGKIDQVIDEALSTYKPLNYRLANGRQDPRS